MKTTAFLLALILAPLVPGLVNQTKAFFAGRRGPGLFRLYFDLFKLLRKSTPRSTTTTWIFDLAPSLALASTLAAALVFPWSLAPSAALPVSAVLFLYLLGTGRFFTVLAALDTGSAFEGMGSSREVQFSALVEPTLLIILGFLALLTGGGSFETLLSGVPDGAWARHAVSLILVGTSFFLLLLSENCRVPFDDPETHLELTMIHEAMILDNAGPDLAFILYGAALKLELFAAFLTAILLPKLSCGPVLRVLVLFGGIAATAVLVGIVESTFARMRFTKTPQVLSGAFLFSLLATLLYVLF